MERFEEISGAFRLQVRSNLAPEVIMMLQDGSALVSVKIGKGKNATLPHWCGRFVDECVVKTACGWMCAFGRTCSIPANTKPKNFLAFMPDAGNKNSCIANSKWTCGSLPYSTVTLFTLFTLFTLPLRKVAALVAQSRIHAASEAGSEVVRISFGKTVAMVRSLWLVLAAGKGIISSKQAHYLQKESWPISPI